MLSPVLILTMMQSTPDLQAGSTLYVECRAATRVQDDPKRATEEDLDASTICTAYISGFVDASTLSHAVCLGAETTMATYARLYVAYMQSHPKDMDALRSLGLYHALKANYPCQSK
jgi:hypothetical protein